jgi:hypothetical protein
LPQVPGGVGRGRLDKNLLDLRQCLVRLLRGIASQLRPVQAQRASQLRPVQAQRASDTIPSAASSRST